MKGRPKLTTYKGEQGFWITTKTGKKVFISLERWKAMEDWRQGYEKDFSAAVRGHVGAKVTAWCAVLSIAGGTLAHAAKKCLLAKYLYGVGLSLFPLSILFYISGNFHKYRGYFKLGFRRPKESERAVGTKATLFCIGSPKIPYWRVNLYLRAALTFATIAGLAVEEDPNVLDFLKDSVPIRLRIPGLPTAALFELNYGLIVADYLTGKRESYPELPRKPKKVDVPPAKAVAIYFNRNMKPVPKKEAFFVALLELSKQGNIVAASLLGRSAVGKKTREAVSYVVGGK